MPAEWIWLIFVFAFGSCVGSFLNVVIYRLPRDKSIVTPPSSCPSCGRRIHFYDNIPLISWIVLGAKCRYCKAAISPRYFFVELLTAVLFVLVFVLYFGYDSERFELNGLRGMEAFLNGGWIFYIVHMVLLASFVAASAIDLELWVIPLSICWFSTAVSFVGSAAGSVVASRTPIGPHIIGHYEIFKCGPGTIEALAIGAVVGLVLALMGLASGLLKRSYESEEAQTEAEQVGKEAENEETPDVDFKHRLEILKEVVFLGPIVICAVGAFVLNRHVGQNVDWWMRFSQFPVINGLLSSIWGYFVGCGVVWVTRILGTICFGKEAMGLGDVHLMGAAGAVIGPVFVVVAFFVAPFFGLIWAAGQMFFKKTRQIPYGPFLSLGVFAVMIFHDWFRVQFFGLYLWR